MSRNLGLFLLMSLAWGLTWIPAKVAGAHVPPVAFAAARFVIAAPVLLALARGALPPAGSTGRLLLTGLLINTGCYALLFWGVGHAPTGLAAIVNMSLIPLFSILFGWLHGEEAIDARKLAAIALGVAGLVMLYAGRLPGTAAPDPDQALGLAAIVGATASYCWGAVLSRPLMREMTPLSLAGWQGLVGAVTLALLSLLLEPVGPQTLAALVSWPVNACLAFMILGGTFLAFLIYLRLLRDWGAFRAGLYAFVSPVIAVAAGISVMGEPFGWHEIAGGLVLFAAAALAVSARRAAAPAGKPSRAQEDAA